MLVASVIWWRKEGCHFQENKSGEGCKMFFARNVCLELLSLSLGVSPCRFGLWKFWSCKASNGKLTWWSRTPARVEIPSCIILTVRRWDDAHVPSCFFTLRWRPIEWASSCYWTATTTEELYHYSICKLICKFKSVLQMSHISFEAACRVTSVCILNNRIHVLSLFI